MNTFKTIYRTTRNAITFGVAASSLLACGDDVKTPATNADTSVLADTAATDDVVAAPDIATGPDATADVASNLDTSVPDDTAAPNDVAVVDDVSTPTEGAVWSATWERTNSDAPDLTVSVDYAATAGATTATLLDGTSKRVEVRVASSCGADDVLVLDIPFFDGSKNYDGIFASGTLHDDACNAVGLYFTRTDGRCLGSQFDAPNGQTGLTVLCRNLPAPDGGRAGPPRGDFTLNASLVYDAGDSGIAVGPTGSCFAQGNANCSAARGEGICDQVPGCTPKALCQAQNDFTCMAAQSEGDCGAITGCAWDADAGCLSARVPTECSLLSVEATCTTASCLWLPAGDCVGQIRCEELDATQSWYFAQHTNGCLP